MLFFPREHFLGKKRRIVQIQHGWLDSAYIWDTVPLRSIFRIQDFQDWFFSWNYQTCVTYCVLRREKSSSSHCTSICNSVGIVSLEAHSRAETVWCHEHGEKTPFLHTSTEKKMVVVRWPVNFTSNWLQFCWQMEIGVVAACRPWWLYHPPVFQIESTVNRKPKSAMYSCSLLG